MQKSQLFRLIMCRDTEMVAPQIEGLGGKLADPLEGTRRSEFRARLVGPKATGTRNTLGAMNRRNYQLRTLETRHL